MIFMFRTGDIHVSPSDVKWSSSNIKVATVDKKGNVRAAAPGTAKISAKFSGKTASWAANGWYSLNYNGILEWYYFNEVSDGTRGALMTNTQIGEYYVNEQGDSK